MKRFFVGLLLGLLLATAGIASAGTQHSEQWEQGWSIGFRAGQHLSCASIREYTAWLRHFHGDVWAEFKPGIVQATGIVCKGRPWHLPR